MNYHKIEKFSVENGIGIRVVLWVGGCSLHCKGCHNPETWSFASGKPFDENAKQELFEALNKPYIKGLTLSGGHPLEPQNVQTVLEILKDVKYKFPQKDIWLYTGYTLDTLNFTTMQKGISFKCEYGNCLHHNLMCQTLNLCDVVVDGRFIEEKKNLTLPFCGSSNQRLIDVRKTIQQNKIVLWDNQH